MVLGLTWQCTIACSECCMMDNVMYGGTHLALRTAAVAHVCLWTEGPYC